MHEACLTENKGHEEGQGCVATRVTVKM
jgi:hypothetical protein